MREIPIGKSFPRAQSDIGNVFFTVSDQSGGKDAGRLFSDDYRNATVTLFYRDYSNLAAKNALEAAKDFYCRQSTRTCHVPAWRVA